MALYVGVEIETDIIRPYDSRHAQLLISRNTTSTRHGNGPNHEDGVKIYLDSPHPEVCTAPLKIERGVASRLTARIAQAQCTLEETLEGMPLRGHSMHINITYAGNVSQATIEGLQEAYATIANLKRGAGTNTSKQATSTGARLEQRVDYVHEQETQIALNLLLLATATDPANCANKPHYITSHQTRSNTLGRDKRFRAMSSHCTKQKIMSGQEFLQATYEHFLPSIQLLATPQEQETLQRYARGDAKHNGETVRPEKIDTKNLVTEGDEPLKKLYGSIAAGRLPNGEKLTGWRLDWERARIGLTGGEIELNGLDEMQKIADEFATIKP